MGYKSKGIVSWPDEERPRERLLSRGAEALTDAELIAIVIRVGFKGTNAVELGRQLLTRFGSLRAMVEASALDLLSIKGLKGAKAAQLMAAIEIARRAVVPARTKSLTLMTTTAAAEYIRERLRGLAEEQFRVLYLNRRNALLEDVLISHGAVETVKLSLRSIVSHALRLNAIGLIAAHNHPSGVAEPSEADRLMTEDMLTAARPLGIKVLDHIIVSEEKTFSFADSGILDEIELMCMAPLAKGKMRNNERETP
jgi:DNA repair protein RadC